LEELSDIPDETIYKGEKIMRVSQEKLDQIKTAMDAEKKARIFKRYQALYLYLSGKKCIEVADIVGITKNAVSNIHIRYKTEGLAGIPDKLRPGRPQRLSEEQEAVLRDVIITKVPSEVGFPADYNWTAGLIAKYIKREFSFDYSIRGITGMFERMGLSYTRPTYVLAKADKQKQEQFKQDFEGVKKTVE